MTKIKFKDGSVKNYAFDELSGISEQGGYFIVSHLGGLTLFDKRQVEEVTED